MRARMLVLLWMLPLTLMAQESKDSLSINLPSTLTEQDIRELTAPIRVENTGYTGTDLGNNLKTDLIETGALTKPEDYKPLEVRWYGAPLFPKGSVLPSWSTGYMYGSLYRRSDARIFCFGQCGRAPAIRQELECQCRCFAQQVFCLLQYGIVQWLGDVATIEILRADCLRLLYARHVPDKLQRQDWTSLPMGRICHLPKRHRCALRYRCRRTSDLRLLHRA